MIYLASPYSDPDPRVRKSRFIAARDYCDKQMRLGETIFSPIAYGHQFATEYEHPGDHEYWVVFNEHMMLLASEIRVLKLPGWEASRGIAYELAFAERAGIEVTYANP